MVALSAGLGGASHANAFPEVVLKQQLGVALAEVRDALEQVLVLFLAPALRVGRLRHLM